MVIIFYFLLLNSFINLTKVNYYLLFLLFYQPHSKKYFLINKSRINSKNFLQLYSFYYKGTINENMKKIIELSI